MLSFSVAPCAPPHFWQEASILIIRRFRGKRSCLLGLPLVRRSLVQCLPLLFSETCPGSHGDLGATPSRHDGKGHTLIAPQTEGGGRTLCITRHVEFGPNVAKCIGFFSCEVFFFFLIIMEKPLISKTLNFPEYINSGQSYQTNVSRGASYQFCTRAKCWCDGRQGPAGNVPDSRGQVRRNDREDAESGLQPGWAAAVKHCPGTHRDMGTEHTVASQLYGRMSLFLGPVLTSSGQEGTRPTDYSQRVQQTSSSKR